jgi:hypothetical protein
VKGKNKFWLWQSVKYTILFKVYQCKKISFLTNIHFFYRCLMMLFYLFLITGPEVNINANSLIQPINRKDKKIQWRHTLASHLCYSIALCCISSLPTPQKIKIYIGLGNLTLDAVECWKPFNIPNCIIYIKQAMDAIKPETANACWRNLWSKCMNEIFLTTDNEVRWTV